MSDAVFLLTIVACAACFALVEIHIEGPAGWAANLPTWRWSNRVLEWLMPGRPLTGYHLWVLVFIAIVAHVPFAFGLPWSGRTEMRSLAFVVLFWVFEDFLWFVLNPHYGIRKFHPQFISWHKRAWWWIAPRDYWLGLLLGTALYLSSREPRAIYVVMAN